MVIAYVTLHPDQECSAEDIEKALLSHLAVYAIPQVCRAKACPDFLIIE
jgi:acyl-CoA synthetase (AMP-forming)/AMP-acid ligase II